MVLSFIVTFVYKMNNALFNIKLYCLVWTFLLATLTNGQFQDEVLSQTIIFKIKETHRAKCSITKIDDDRFNSLLNEVGVSKLQKIFPNKQKEERTDFIDLSLIYELHYTKSFTIQEVIAKINWLKITDYVEPYYLPKLCFTPNDTLLIDQWYITKIDAENAWTTQKGDTNIVIGITDTGWDPTHPDLVDNVKKNYADPINGLDDDADGYIDNYLGWDLGSNDNDALWESTGHGVYVTGLAAAATNNVTGVAGVGFNTKFLPVKISDNIGILTQAYQGVVYAADHGCDIINCSWGSFTPSQFNKSIIDYAIVNKGCMVVGAVGNDNGDNVFYPAGYPGVFSVAATEQNDLKKNNSNYGYYVDISAPGEAMKTTGPNGGYGVNGGTSMAAPIVAGAAAIVKSQYPAYTNEQIIAVLRATADDLNILNPTFEDKLGSGRVNLFKGVNTSNPKFIELTNYTTTDNNNNIFVLGDTILIEGFFTNWLDPLSGLSVTISSTSPYVNVLDGVTNLPVMATLMSTTNVLDKFAVEVLGLAPLNEVVTFKAVITNGSYTSTEYFTIILNTDYLHLEENLIATTITSKGKIGFNDTLNTVGLGFAYKGNQLLFEAGLMIGNSTSRVASSVRGVSGWEDDFQASLNVQEKPPFKSSKDLYGVMDNALMASPLELNVVHYSYAYKNAPDDKFVILYYEIENMSSSTINNLYAGIFADWDIKNATANKAGYDASRSLGYVYAMDKDSLYAAIKVLSTATVNNYAFDLDGSSGIDVNGGGFTTAEKYTAMSTTKNTAGDPTGKDVAHAVSTGNVLLLPGQKMVAAFALIAGDSLLDIQASADAAQLRFNSDNLSVTESIENNQIQIYPNPTKGFFKINTKLTIDKVVLRNLLGEIVATFPSNQIDISNQPDGVYLVEVVTDKSIEVKKILLVK